MQFFRYILHKARQPRLSCKIANRSIICLCASALLWSMIFYYHESSSIQKKAETQTQALIKATVDPSIFPTLDYERALLTRLTPIAHIAGARLEDLAGTALIKFGKEPELTSWQAERQRLTARQDDTGRYLDIYLSPDSSGLTHATILRIDLASYIATARENLLNLFLALLVIAAITYCGIRIILHFSLMKPIQLMHDALSRVLPQQDIADQLTISHNSSDELGLIMKMVNTLLNNISKQHQNLVHTAYQFIEHSPVPVLIYDHAEKLVYANHPALKLFEAENTTKLAQRDQGFIRIKHEDRTKSEITTACKYLHNASSLTENIIITPSGDVNMICMGTCIQQENDTIRHHVVQLMDIGELYTRIFKEKNKEENRHTNKTEEQKIVALKTLLESCLVLLNPLKATRSNIGIINIEHIIKIWSKKQQQAGGQRQITFHDLPLLSGNTTIIDTLFRQALSFMDFRSNYQNSTFILTSTRKNNMVIFDLLEKLPSNPEEKIHHAINDKKAYLLCLTALQQLIRNAGGILHSHTDPNQLMLSFSLPRSI